MLRSLVGSEMCIRDRNAARGRGRARRESACAEGSARTIASPAPPQAQEPDAAASDGGAAGRAERIGSRNGRAERRPIEAAQASAAEAGHHWGPRRARARAWRAGV